MTPNIFKSSDGYVVEYEEALEYEDKQQDINWTAKEIAVEDDINDLRVHATDAERHGILHVLKLFTQYELFAGDEYWNGKFSRMFPRVEFRRMAAQFAQVELCVHAPFYNSINEALFLNTPEFYNAWKEDPVLAERMEFIESSIGSRKFDGLLSLAIFSMVEGAILYSSFAFLKSFKKGGRNFIPNIVSGINFSVRDENLHSEGGAWAFRTALSETVHTLKDMESDIYRAALDLYDHEAQIIDQIFSKGEIEGMDAEDMKAFVKSRINLCLSQLGLPPVFLNDNNSISQWFYDDIAGAKSTDHFATLSSNYSRAWKEQEFSW